MNPGLKDLIIKIRELGFKIKLDTNGFHPEVLKELLSDGLLDYVAMDIKNSPAKYAVTCGLENVDMEKILKSISLLKESGIDYEFRTTVIDEFHEKSDFDEICKMIEGAPRYYLQAFTDRDSVPFSNLHAPDKQRMLEFAEVSAFFVPETHLRGVE